MYYRCLSFAGHKAPVVWKDVFVCTASFPKAGRRTEGSCIQVASVWKISGVTELTWWYRSLSSRGIVSLSFLLGGIKIWEWIIRTRTELRERSQMWRKRLFEYFRRSKTLIGETCFLPMKAVDRHRKVGLTYIPLLKELVFQMSLVYSLRHLTLFCYHPNHVGTQVSLVKRTIKSFLGFTLSESLLAIRLQRLWVPLGLGRGNYSGPWKVYILSEGK